MTQQPKNTAVKRVIASLIDILILGITGYLMAIVGENFFVQLGIHGVLIGWFITTIYYAIFNSNVGNGQSPGKRAMGLEVLNYQGEHLDFKNGLIRSLMFTSPLFLLDYVQNLFYIPIVTDILGGISIAYYVGLLYFFLANADRRTVHDLIVQTNVRYEGQDIQQIVPVSKTKIYIYVGIITLIIGGAVGTYLAFKDRVSSLTEVVKVNQEVLGEIASEVYELEQVMRIQSSKINVTVESEVGIVIEAWVDHDVNSLKSEQVYKEIMDIVSTKEFKINRLDYVQVILKYGYDIGITDHTSSKSWYEEINN